MLDKQAFIGRQEELNEFEKFLNGERPNWEGPDKGAPVLIVEGEPAIGKRSLLREMARLASEQEHLVYYKEVSTETEFYPAIYTLIGLFRKAKPAPKDKLGKLSHWLDFTLILGGMLVPQLKSVKDLWSLSNKIRDEHDSASKDESYLASLLCTAISSLVEKIGEDQRVVILLYPKRESPPWLVLLFELMRPSIPEKARFVIAQKPNDHFIECARKVAEGRDLRKVCAKPIHIGPFKKKADCYKFVEVNDKKNKLGDPELCETFIKRYAGWPFLMGEALTELEKIDKPITKDIIMRLPGNVYGFWEERLKEVKEEFQRVFVQTVNILPHAYKSDDVALFADLDPSLIETACSIDCPVWYLLDRIKYTEEIEGIEWEDCPYPKHPTEQDYVVDSLKKKFKRVYLERLQSIGSYYLKILKGEIQQPDISEKDALRHILNPMVEAGLWDQVRDLLGSVEYLKERRSKEQEYLFQTEFIKLMMEIPFDRLVSIFKTILDTIYSQLENNKDKANWLDTFAYWINEFGVKNAKKMEDLPREAKLKELANEFDMGCGQLSKELTEQYIMESDYNWALRFAELYTWVYQRAGKDELCVKACEYAEEKCCQSTDEAYRYLGTAEFLRMRALALRRLAKGKKTEDEIAYVNAQADETYTELMKIFPQEKTEIPWPSIREWKQIENIIEKEEDLVLKSPSNNESPIFKARVISNLDDCISAMAVIDFFEKSGGHVE
jgi:hypothetical protein